MTDRDDALLDLRPTIPPPEASGGGAAPDASGVAAFMHGTLRPVLKLQNEALLLLVAADLRSRVPGFAAFAPDDQRQRLAGLLRKDSRLKRTLIGVVYGALTAAELRAALADEAEIRRRIVSMLVERVTSQTETVSRMVEDTSPPLP